MHHDCRSAVELEGGRKMQEKCRLLFVSNFISVELGRSQSSAMELLGMGSPDPSSLLASGILSQSGRD